MQYRCGQNLTLMQLLILNFCTNTSSAVWLSPFFLNFDSASDSAESKQYHNVYHWFSFFQCYVSMSLKCMYLEIHDQWKLKKYDKSIKRIHLKYW